MNFDRIARAYRWMEYLALGTLLERTREHHIPRLMACRRALILGDGDGRFTARLLEANAELQIDAVDLSRTMLALLEKRLKGYVPHLRDSLIVAEVGRPRSPMERTVPQRGTRQGMGGADRLRLHHADARTFAPTHTPDLIVTHFFLDCLTQTEVDRLVARLAAPGMLWLVSDFRVPEGLMRWPARAYVRLLYFAFRILTGLRVKELPDYERSLRTNGFVPVAIHHAMFGVLTTELWWRD